MSEPARVVAVLSDGRRIEVAVTNLGWDAWTESYATQFEFDGQKVLSHFTACFETMMICPEPSVRLAHDEEFLRDALRIRCGCAYVDDLEVID